MFLVLVTVLSVRADDVPVMITPIDDSALTIGSSAAIIDLKTHFTLPGVNAAQIMKITTTQGNVFVELLPAAAPNTVTNFLGYVNDGSYSGSIIHRSEPGFVIQGGGFKAVSGLAAIAAKTAVANEYNLPNSRGTLAMAKLGGQPNSATNQWFFNLVDNTDSLGPANNGGFTVFARVLGKGMTVVDAIAALPTFDLNSINAAFNTLPLDGVLPGQSQLYLTNLVTVTSIAAAPTLYPLTKTSPAVFSFNVLNSNPAVVTAAIAGSTLTLTPGKVAGRSLVTVRDLNGNFNNVTFTVSVAAVLKPTPVSQTVQVGQTATFAITPGAAGTTYQWQRKTVGTIPWISLSETSPYAGTTTASLNVDPTTLAMGGDQFQCLVTTGAITAARSGATLLIVPAPLAVVPTQKVDVTGSVSLDLSGGTPGGLTYFATGLPTGLGVSAVTGKITGVITAKAGIYVVTCWSQKGTVRSATQTFTFVVRAFPVPMVAIYEGLLVGTDGVPVGKLELNVTATGAYTGKLTCSDVQIFTLRGQLALNADYSAATSTLTLTRSAAPGAPYTLVLNALNNSTLAATLKIGATPIGTLAGPDSATVPPTTATGASWLGKFTLLLAAPQNLDSSPLNDAAAPVGVGYATLKIPTSGLMAITGKTADGTLFTASLVTSYNASYRAYIKPYKTAGGYLTGWLQMTTRSDSTTPKPVYHIASATGSDFYWGKPPASADKTYPAGFGPVGLNVSAEPWVPTVSLAGTFPLSVGQAGLSNVNGNTDNLPLNLNLTSAYVVTLAAPSDLANPSHWTVKVNTATGSFAGSFTVVRTVNGKTATLTVPLEGAFLQRLSPASGTPFAQGYFLLPPSDGAGSTTRSGSIQISTPAPSVDGGSFSSGCDAFRPNGYFIFTTTP